MKLFNLKKLAVVTALGIATIFGMSVFASAQGGAGQRDRNQTQDRRGQKPQQQADQNFAKSEQARIKAEQARAKAEQDRLRAEQQRQAENNRQHNNTRNNGNWNNGHNNGNTVINNRYRIYRNGSYYNTDQRGADMLRQAVNAGYQQGLAAGQADRNSRRGSNWSNSSIYRNGTYGYQSYVDRGQYQYYFQQGFERGYQDGYNSRYQYGNGGSILGDIIGSILNIQVY